MTYPVGVRLYRGEKMPCFLFLVFLSVQGGQRRRYGASRDRSVVSKPSWGNRIGIEEQEGGGVVTMTK